MPPSAHQEIAGSDSYRSASNFPHRTKKQPLRKIIIKFKKPKHPFKPWEKPAFLSKARREKASTPPTAPPPRPVLRHFTEGTRWTLLLTYFRRRLRAINNQQQQRNAALAETSPATSRPGPGEAAAAKGREGPVRSAPRRRRPNPRAAAHPRRPGRPPGRAAERFPEFSCRVCRRGEGVSPTQTSPSPAMPAAGTGWVRRGAFGARRPQPYGRSRGSW